MYCTSLRKDLTKDKLKLTGRNLGRVLNSRLRCACMCHAISYITKRPNLKLKTQPEQLLGSLTLAFALPATTYYFLLIFCKISLIGWIPGRKYRKQIIMHSRLTMVCQFVLGLMLLIFYVRKLRMFVIS
jgi:hypothetical protein